MEAIIFILIFFGSPIIAFIVSFYKLSKYRDAKLNRIINPDYYTDDEIKDMKKGVIVSFVVATILIIVIMSILVLLGNAISYM